MFALLVLRRALLAMVVGALVLGSGSLGGSANAATEVATQINVTSVTTPGIDVPATPGAPASFVVANVPFTVETTFTGADGVTPLPISATKDVTLVVTATSGPDQGKTVGTALVPAGATSASITGVKLSAAANGVALQVAGFVKKQPVDGLAPGLSGALAVQKSFVSAPATSTLTSIGPGGGVGLTCAPTTAEPTCAELYLPNSAGVLSNQLLSLGACDSLLGCPPKASVVQALVNVDPTIYTRTSPMTLVVKCDKTMCTGGVTHLTLKVALTQTSTPVTAPACEAKGQIQEGEHFCVDYVQSKRDNAGDSHLYLLLDEDARVWNG